MQQQTGTSDCGLFVIAFAVETCLKKNVELVAMREHLYRYLESGKITSFPKIDLNVLFHSIDQTLNINVYCICRLPDIFDNEMVE